jgi:xanthosine utilization system XapX-like protein
MKIDKRKLRITIFSIVVGLIGGYAYWKFIGCTSGTCPLTSNWYNSTLIGGVFGYLISDSFQKKTEISKDTETATKE